MKISFKYSLLSVILIIVMIGIHSCKEETPELVPSDPDVLTVDIDKLNKEPTFNSKEDQITFIVSSQVMLDPTQYNAELSNGQLESVIVRTSEVKSEYLGQFFPGLDPSLQVLTITYLKTPTDQIDGLILHVADTEGYLKLVAYHRSGQNTFRRIPLQGSLVSSFTLDNTLFVARKLFPKRDIFTIGGTGIQHFEPRNTFDDVSLLRFISKYNIPVPGYENLITRRAKNDAARTELDSFIDGPDGGKPCALAVHHCRNGDNHRTQCMPFHGGCYPAGTGFCPRIAASTAFSSHNMISEQSTFEATLPTSQLYSFENWLQLQPQGQFYVDAYYTTSTHFEASLDIPLLYDITAASVDMSEFVSAMMNNDPNYVMSTSDYNEFVQIAQRSSNNSQSTVYRDLISTLIVDVQRFQGQDVDEINTMLESEQLFPAFE